MTFRNPITSAAAVDTGQPTGAGARLYQGSDVSGVFGILEFRDGISGDSPGQVAGRGYLTPQGNGAFTAQGGTLSLKCGNYNQTPGPELDLNVESSPTGGFRGIARLTRSPIYGPDTGPTSLVPNLVSGWLPWDTAGNLPRIQLTSNGTVQTDGIVKIPTGGSFAAGAVSQVATFPTETQAPDYSYSPALPAFRPVVLFNPAGGQAGVAQLQIQPTGLYVVNTTGGALSAGYGWSLGASYLP